MKYLSAVLLLVALIFIFCVYLLSIDKLFGMQAQVIS